MWDLARVWRSLDRTWEPITKLLQSTRYEPGVPPKQVFPAAIRIDPAFQPDGSFNSNVKVHQHMVWMFEEIKKLAQAGDMDKAIRWLGFLQGVAWARGMVSIEMLKEANRAQPQRKSFQVDDFVTCAGEAQTIFRVAKLSEGYMEFTGCAYLLKAIESTDHGWEDFSKLQIVADANDISATRLLHRAHDFRVLADNSSSRGRKLAAHNLHDDARKLEAQAYSLLEQKKNV